MFKYGKHANKPIDTVPLDYLQWILRNSENTIEMVRKEITRRTGETFERRRESDQRSRTRSSYGSANKRWIEKIIKAGYRALMLKHHPDAGGTTQDAQEVNAAFDELERKVL